MLRHLLAPHLLGSGSGLGLGLGLESFLCCVICSRRTCADAEAGTMCTWGGAHAVRIGAGLLAPPRQG